MKKKESFKVISFIGSIWLLFFMVTAVNAHTVKQILQPYEDDIQLCNEASYELSLQGARHERELKEELAQLRFGYGKGINLNKQRLRAEHIRRREMFQTVSSAFHQLIYDPQQPRSQHQSHIPQVGWLNRESLYAREKQNRTLSNKEDLTLKNEETTYWVVDLGHISEKILKTYILAKQKEITQLVNNKNVFQIHYPGLGWVTRNILKKRIKENTKKITDIRKHISEGTYSVNLPKFGWVTRNNLLERIKKIEEEIKNTNNLFRNKKATLWRHYLGWTNQDTVEASIEKINKNIKTLESEVHHGTFSANLSGEGWTSRNKLIAKISKYKEAQTQIEVKLSSSNYKVPVLGFSWLDYNQIKLRFKQGGLSKKQKAALSRGISHIGNAGGTDLRVYDHMIRKLQNHKHNIGKHAEPRKRALTRDRDRRKQIILEAFRREKNNILSRLKRKKAYLEQSLNLIPWKLPSLPTKKPLKITGYAIW